MITGMYLTGWGRDERLIPLLDQNNVIGLGLQYQNLPLLHNTIRIGKFHNQIEMLNKMRFFFKTKYKKNTLL